MTQEQLFEVLINKVQPFVKGVFLNMPGKITWHFKCEDNRDDINEYVWSIYCEVTYRCLDTIHRHYDIYNYDVDYDYAHFEIKEVTN